MLQSNDQFRYKLIAVALGIFISSAPDVARADDWCGFPQVVERPGFAGIVQTSYCPNGSPAAFVSQMKDYYDMERDEWNDGFGWTVPCDSTRAFGRTLNALQILHFASPNAPSRTDDFAGNLLRWGGNYAIRHIAELRAICGDSAYATTTTNLVPGLRKTELKKKFFWQLGPVARAAVLVHEARHADGCRHNGGDGANACKLNGKTCQSADESWEDGCMYFDTVGANYYGIVWVHWYLIEGKAWYKTEPMITGALTYANMKLAAFDVPTCLQMAPSGYFVQVC